jgi:hypothetical protein
MARALLAGVFAVVMSVLVLLPGSAHDSAAPAPRTSTSAPATEDPTVTGSPDQTSPTRTEPPEPACTPATPLVDAEATPEAVCLAATLDGWRASGRFGLGQQLNVSSRSYLRPLRQLQPERPAVVGFDLDELAQGETYGFAEPPLDQLLELAQEGVVLTASWHTRNPSTGGDSYDKGWQDIGALLDPSRSEYVTFWADVDAKLDLLRRLQDGDGGRYAPAAVVFRPLHEANGDWFWWAQGADPTTYRSLYAAIQQRAAEAGVHNIVWGWSANARNDARITDPLTLLPDRVDLAGVDSYEQMTAQGEGVDGIDGVDQGDLDLSGLVELADRVPRVAVTEAGPHGSKDGRWDPALVAPRARSLGVDPVYVMMWFDDGNADDGYTGKKQLGSLSGGRALLAQCPSGVCSLS